MARNTVVIRTEWARVGRLSSRKGEGEGEELIVFPQQIRGGFHNAVLPKAWRNAEKASHLV